jgi:heptosyltransferase-3
VRDQSPVRRVLIYRFGSLGDTVFALPCLHLIERSFPTAERVLLTNFPVHAKAPAAAAVLGDSGLVSGYMRYAAGTRDPVELLRLALRIRRFKPDLLIWLMAIRKASTVPRDLFFFRRICGIQHMIGLPDALERSPVPDNASAARHRLFDAATGLYEPEPARLARHLSSLGDAHLAMRTSWGLRLTGAERQKAEAVLAPLGARPLIVCGPGTKMQSKDWGAENWRALLERLNARYAHFALAVVGSAEEAAVGAAVLSGWTGAKVNLCGLLTPRETAAVLERARVFLGHDSGPTHLAASLGVPCVAAYSARTIPGAFYPYGEGHQVLYPQVECAGCYLETCIERDRACMRSITVAQMEQAVARVLSPVAKNLVEQ